jgi:hypothetical protein
VSRGPAGFGVGYLARRARLAALVAAVGELARQTGVDLSAAEDGLAGRLSEPFRFLVLGEVNAGKSTLLSGLFGVATFPAGVLPHRQRIEHYRFGSPEGDAAGADGIAVCNRGEGFLRDFEVIDTPGTNGGLKGQEKLVEGMFPCTDLILVVVPVSNPWGAATWEMVSRVPAGLLGRVVFVIQQADQRQPGDLKVICEHVVDLAQKRIGVTPRVFPVAGRDGLAGKLAGDRAAVVRSGLGALEEFIEREVCESPGRLAELREMRELLAGLLRRIEDRMEDQVRLGEDHGAFLRQLEAEVDHEREKHTRGFARKGGGLAEVFAAECASTTKFLRRRLSMLRSFASLLGTDSAAPETEKYLVEVVKVGTEARARADANALMDVCRDHWAALQPRVRARMGLEIPPFQQCLAGLTKTRDEFVQRLGLAARQPVLALKLRAGLDEHLRRRRAGMSRWMSLALVVVTAAGVAGYLALELVPWLALAVAGLVSLIAAAHGWRTRRRILDEFADDLLGARYRFEEMLVDDYQTGVRGFFLEYATMFQAVRQRIAESKQALAPRMERWNELFLALKELEQEL